MNLKPQRGDVERPVEREFMSPFQGFDDEGDVYQGLRPWLHDLAPPGPIAEMHDPRRRGGNRK